MEVSETEFYEYVEICKLGGSGRPKVDNESTDVRLTLYGLGCQGKQGDCNTNKPGMFEIKEKLKWEAWMKIKGKDQKQAQKEFVELAKKILTK